MTEVKGAGNPLWIAYEYGAMLFGLGALTLICALWLPLALACQLFLPRRWGQVLGRGAITFGCRLHIGLLGLCCACRFDLRELDLLRHSGPLILAANHPSRLDALLILSRLPNVVCVMKAALMDHLLFGSAARLARYIRNDAALAMILDARDELRAGARLLIFPEGSRTGTFPVDRCLPSTGLIAARAGVPVQTLLIEFSTPYLGRAWPLFKRPALPLHCRIRLGRRFAPPTDVGAFASELETYFRTELTADSRSTVAITT